ncbi:MAG TPA: RidA family protein [Dehalococcoidia bacterium]|nr:RidA family protein [Dehalococcoidia bacterium]
MEKQTFDAGIPLTGGPFNLCVRFGPLLFISGLPPFDEAYSALLRDARANGRPLPPPPNTPFEQEAETVMNRVKALVEEAGSNMDCLLKVNVWLKDQGNMEIFDRIYRRYFSDPTKLPARTRLQAGATPLDCGLEVEAVGYVPGATW